MSEREKLKIKTCPGRGVLQREGRGWGYQDEAPNLLILLYPHPHSSDTSSEFTESARSFTSSGLCRSRPKLAECSLNVVGAPLPGVLQPPVALASTPGTDCLGSWIQSMTTFPCCDSVDVHLHTFHDDLSWATFYEGSKGWHLGQFPKPRFPKDNIKRCT